MKTFPVSGLLGRLSKLGAVSAIALSVAGYATAQGTNAGTAVENTFTLDYTVGTEVQPTITNDPDATGNVDIQGDVTDATFTVDRVVNLTVTATDTEFTGAPGEQDVEVSFTLRNDGNDDHAYVLDVVDLGGTLDAIGTADVFYIDPADGTTLVAITQTDSTSGAWTSGTAPAANLTPVLAPGETLTIVIQSDIPVGADDAILDDVGLIAQAREPDAWAEQATAAATTGTATLGAVLVADAAGDNTNAQNGLAENIFADVDGGVGVDGDNDAAHSAETDLLVVSPDLTGAKDVILVSDDPAFACDTFAGATTTPAAATSYFTPGACVEYVITVTNSSDNAAAVAEAITVSDTLPADIEFLAVDVVGFDNYVEADDLTAPASGDDCDGTAATCQVTVTGVDLNPNTTVGTDAVATVRIRARVL